jgi:hypothetical protein
MFYLAFMKFEFFHGGENSDGSFWVMTSHILTDGYQQWGPGVSIFKVGDNGSRLLWNVGYHLWSYAASLHNGPQSNLSYFVSIL